METLKFEIVNKKAKGIIKELAGLKLINIQEIDPAKSFQTLLKRLRSAKETLSLEEITKEVEFVRQKRYAKKG